MKRIYSLIFIILIYSVESPVYSQSCGNYGKNGEDHCPCDTCPTSSGDPFDPYTGNEYRASIDLEVWGGVGEIPLVWMRYANSRFGNYVYNYGVAHNWNSSFNYNMFDWGTNAQGRPQVLIHYPEGGHNIFTQSSSDPGLWLSVSAVTKRLLREGNNFILQMYNGYRYRFEKLTDLSGATYYQLQDIRDSHQNLYKLTYDSEKHLTKITEPAGRYLQVTYDSIDNGSPHRAHVITEVASSDGRSVRYNYGVISDALNGFGWVSLMSVDYGDGTKAVYTYSQSEPGSRPNLEHALDPRYKGTDVNMRFTYDNDNVWGFVKEEINGVTGKVMVSLTSEPGSRTVCYANGRVQHFKMPDDLMGMIKEYTDGLGRKTTFAYDLEGTTPGDIGFMKTETDGLGRVTTYDKRTVYGNPLEMTHPDGSKEKWTRDNLDLILTHIDELGRTTIFTRDNRHRVTRIRYPDGSTERFSYNNFGQVLAHTLRNGGVEINTYDNRGLKTSFSDALGNTTIYVYDGADRLASLTDARGKNTKYAFNERGLLTKAIFADGNLRTYQYDNFGNRTHFTNELGNTWTTGYDEFKRVVSSKDPLNHETKYDYGLPGEVCGCQHDQGKPTSIILPTGKIIRIDYDVEWQIIRRTEGAGSADEATTSYEYDVVGNVETTIDANGKLWKFTFDSRDRRNTSTDPLGHQTKYTYDPAGNMLQVIRPDNGITKTVYDNMDRPVQVTDPKGQTTKFKYDDEGNTTRLTDPNNRNYNFGYDLLNRTTKMAYPGGSFESFTYDAVGNLKMFKTRAGQLRTYAYDDRNREILSDWSDATPDITRTYDAAGRILTLVSAVSTLSYTYNNANELTGETQKAAGAGSGKNVSYSYDPDGLRSNITYPGGTILNYDYTARHQLSTISEGGSNLVKYTYDPEGNRLTKTLQNGTSTTYSYDDDYRMLSLVNQNTGGPFARFDYGFDNVDRRTFVKRENARGDLYSYDAIDQIIGVKYDVTDPGGSPGTPVRTVNYELDPAGNRIQVTDNGVATNYVTNQLNQYKNVGSSILTYNNNGNLRAYNGWTYTYDAQDRLIRARNTNTTVRFDYDPRNRCVRRTVNGKASFFYYDAFHVIEERNAADQALAVYTHGATIDEIITKASAGSLVYYYLDAQGNITHLGNAAGNVIEQYTYDAFGAPTIRDGAGNVITVSAFGNRFLFTGREFISEVNLYDYRHRFYSFELGKFLQVDPVGFGAQDVNLYRYCSNDPINWVDPLGFNGQKDPNSVNCLGYACRLTDAYDPKATESLKDALESEGYKCTKDISAKDCPKHCNCEDYVMLYIYIDKKHDFGKMKEKYKGKDPYSDKLWDPSTIGEIDFHALRGGAGGNYTYQPNRQRKGSPRDFTKDPKKFSPTDASPDYFEEAQLLGKVCCCKKK